MAQRVNRTAMLEHALANSENAFPMAPGKHLDGGSAASGPAVAGSLCARRRLVVTADARCVQQWLPAAAVDDLTGSSSDRRQASLEKAAAAVATHVLAGKPGGAEAFAQLLSLYSRCAAGVYPMQFTDLVF